VVGHAAGNGFVSWLVFKFHFFNQLPPLFPKTGLANTKNLWVS
jgi:hypothetical protein